MVFCFTGTGNSLYVAKQLDSEQEKAVHTMENCQLCMACIHHCPKNAIRLNMPEKNPDARYHNENIRLTEIVEANNQHR